MKRLVPLVVLSAVAVAAAEDAGPLVRARVEPAGSVMVGEPVRLVVDVLTPTWFLAPPQFPTLEVPDAIVLFQERGLNLNESIAGTSYSGLQREYIVIPMRAGRFEIPPFEVSVVYAVDTKPSEPTPVSTRSLSFEATIPSGAEGLAHFVSASRLDIRQSLDPQPKDLVVGGALRRTITIDAEGAFGMMLPPLPVPVIDGLSVYPDPPQVADRSGERGQARTARRVESVAYRLDRAGDYELPAVAIAWWDTGAKRMRKSTVAAIAFSVAPAPALADEIPLPPETETPVPAASASPEDRWATLIRWSVPALIALAVLAWTVPGLARRASWVGGRLAEARRRWQDSEPARFARVRRSAANGDAARTYRALLDWAQRSARRGPRTLDALVVEAGDAVLGAEIGRLATTLYSLAPAPMAWEGSRLIERLRAARRRRARWSTARDASTLGQLNPSATVESERRQP
jgi:hypothetical protein